MDEVHNIYIASCLIHQLECNIKIVIQHFVLTFKIVSLNLLVL